MHQILIISFGYGSSVVVMWWWYLSGLSTAKYWSQATSKVERKEREDTTWVTKMNYENEVWCLVFGFVAKGEKCI